MKLEIETLITFNFVCRDIYLYVEKLQIPLKNIYASAGIRI